MEGCDKLIALTSSNNFALYFCQHFCIAPYLFNIWCTDKGHWDIAINTFYRSLDIETTELTTIGITQGSDIHSGNTIAWFALDIFGKEYQACTSTINRKSCGNGILNWLHQTKLVEKFSLCSALTTWDNKTILWLIPILKLANLKTFYTKLFQLLTMLSESTLQC